MDKKYCFIDFEFNRTSEEFVTLVCVAFQVEGSPLQEVWLEGYPNARKDLKDFFYSMKDTHIFTAYSVEAEARSFLSLGLTPTDFYWLDLYIEYRMILNHNHGLSYGKQLIDGYVRYTNPPINKWKATEEQKKKGRHDKPRFGLDAACFNLLGVEIDSKHKKFMRNRIIAGGPFSTQEKIDILKYCGEDVVHLKSLRDKIVQAFKGLSTELPTDFYIDECLLRGEYAARTAIMVSKGYPVDVDRLRNFIAAVPMLQNEMKEDVNNKTRDEVGFDIYVWNKREQRYKERQKRCKEYIATLKIKDWMKTDKGDYSLSLEAFERQTSARHTYKDTFLDQMLRVKKFQQSLNGFLPPPKTGKKKKVFTDYMGSDGRARPHMGIFVAQSSRSQPAATGFIPLKAAWMRCMIQPQPGRLCCGIDWGSQEFLIAALLSEDDDMIAAYNSGDVYLATAKLAGEVPEYGTLEEYKAERNLFKSVVLGISYDMGPAGLAKKLTSDTGRNYTQIQAEELIDKFKTAYPVYQIWKQDHIKNYKDRKGLRLPCGWCMWGDNDNEKSVGNVPIQGAGASVMRKAVALAQNAGLEVIFTLHDALYIEYDILDPEAPDILYDCMKKAFEYYLGKRGDIRQDIDIWGPGCPDNGKITTPAGRVANSHSFYLDKRAKEEYDRFSKYLDDPTNLL